VRSPHRLLLLGSPLAALFLLVGSAPLAAEGFTYFGNLGYTTGSYNLSEDTTTLFLVNGFTYEKESWRFSASIPVLDQDTPYVTWFGGAPVGTGQRFGSSDTSMGDTQTGSGMGTSSRRGGRIEVPDPDTVDFSETGVGDPLLRTDFEVADSGSDAFGLFAQVKIPIADEDSGFGTGEWDYGAGVSYHHRFGTGNLFVEGGWWSLGDLPTLELKDPFTGSISYGQAPDGRAVSWLVFVNGWTEVVEGEDALLQAGLTLARRTSSGYRGSLTVTAGLSDTAPDLGVAIGWSLGH